MGEGVKIVFKSGRTVSLSLHSDESFMDFWKVVLSAEFFISGDTLFNVKEVEYAEIE